MRTSAVILSSVLAGCVATCLGRPCAPGTSSGSTLANSSVTAAEPEPVALDAAILHPFRRAAGQQQFGAVWRCTNAGVA
ncbi:MAG: hypothetical protein NTV21_13660 [Planctomycetota bacterium]|nr:hypothetical protein [Planctomycetota bacterium]